MAMVSRRRLLDLTISTVSSLGFVQALPSLAQDVLDGVKILVGYPPAPKRQ